MPDFVKGCPPVKAESSSAAEPEAPRSRKPGPRRRQAAYVAVTLAIAAALVLVALYLTGDLGRSSGSSTTLLVKKGAVDLISQGQFDAVIVHAVSPSVISGDIAVIYVLDMFTMNTSQFKSYVKTLSISGYEWTSGTLQNTTGYVIDAPLETGWWYFVLVNPAPVQTLVGYNSNLVLTPS